MNPATIGKFKLCNKLAEIGEIPVEWDVVRLGDESITVIRGNKTINTFEKIAFIPMDFISDSRIFIKYEMRSKNDVKSFTYCERGDLLLAKITPSLENGKQGIVPDSIPNGFGLATTEVFPISCKGIDRLFLFYILKFPKFRNKIISSMIGTTGRQRASKQSVENLQIPLPPLPEQRRIAEVLGTVDSAIQKVGGAIESTERLKKGLMQRLLTRGIGHERFKFSKELNTEIPEEWNVINLGRATEIIMGQSPPGDTYNTAMNGIYLINGPAEFGEKYPKPNKWTSEPTKITKKNDVLICVRGHTTGRLNISDKELCIGRGVAAIRNLPDATYNMFIYYILDWMRNKIYGISYAAGSIFPNITSEQLNKLSIPLPPLPEQRRIAEILSAVDRKLELERRRKEKLERVKKGLMNELLTGRKRVKVENDGNIY
ncbi:MAG: restriction endonuclease subunit S [Candidatus Methanoperedens sp.]|nr:restriction endonuclease subunit S [Candidatus Methanoperedens sp.]